MTSVKIQNFDVNVLLISKVINVINGATCGKRKVCYFKKVTVKNLSAVSYKSEENQEKKNQKVRNLCWNDTL